jgi:hypothetical protein
MNYKRSNALIRHYFHCDPGKLTFRRWVDLSGESLAELLLILKGKHPEQEQQNPTKASFNQP